MENGTGGLAPARPLTWQVEYPGQDPEAQKDKLVWEVQVSERDVRALVPLVQVGAPPLPVSPPVPSLLRGALSPALPAGAGAAEHGPADRRPPRGAGDVGDGGGRGRRGRGDRAAGLRVGRQAGAAGERGPGPPGATPQGAASPLPLRVSPPQVADSCDAVFVGGKESRGARGARVDFWSRRLHASLLFTVWAPLLPLRIQLGDTTLEQLRGWRLPGATER